MQGRTHCPAGTVVTTVTAMLTRARWLLGPEKGDLVVNGDCKEKPFFYQGLSCSFNYESMDALFLGRGRQVGTSY